MATKREREKRKLRYSDTKQVAADRDTGFVSKAFKVPEGMSVFRWAKEKVYKLDIIAYPVGEGNPMADEGIMHYERTYYCHKNIGPNKDTVLCNAKTLGTKCPICEYRDKLNTDKESGKKLANALKYKERQLMFVRDHDELDKGWQILDSAYYMSFGELLENKCKAGDDDQPFHLFHKLEGGMILKVSVEEDTFEGKTYFKPKNLEMIPRKKAIPESVLDELPCLDELLVPQDYKELKKTFLQVPEDDEEDDDEVEDGSEVEEDEEESPKKKTKPKKKEEEDEEEEEEDEEDEEVEFEKGETVTGEYKDKKFTGKVVKVVNGLVQVKTTKGDLRTMDPDDLEKVEDEDEGEEEDGDEEAPKKSGKSSKTSSKDEDDFDDEDLDLEDDEEEEEEEDEEEEEEKEKPAKKKNKKPADEDEEEEEDEDED